MKTPLDSTTIRGAMLTLAGALGVLLSFFFNKLGIAVTIEEATMLASALLTIIGGLMSIWGRFNPDIQPLK